MNKHSYNKEKIKILLLEGIHTSAAEIFNQKGFFQITSHKTALSESELLDCIGEYNFIGIRSKTHLSAKVLSKAKKLVAVGCFCIGTNQVDLEFATKSGIAVFNSPFSNTRSVAELTIATVIMLMRGIIHKNHLAHLGKWFKTDKFSHEIRGKTLGIVGYGNIGSQVGLIAESMGMRVIFYDIKSKLPYGNAIMKTKLKDVLVESDIVSLHVPETKLTKNMMNSTNLKLMKKGSHLINYARGSLVDIDALCNLLDSEHILTAALDVFPTEPANNEEPFQNKITSYPQVLITPHIGGSTIEAQEKIGVEVANFLSNYCDYGCTESAVNFPTINLSVQEKGTRFLHIHQNRTGMLSAINDEISKRKVNINAQHLDTFGEIGLVVFDLEIDRDEASKLLKSLKAIDGTIKSRLMYS